MGKEGFVSIGKIIGAHGVKGALKVYSYAESPSIFEPGVAVVLKDTEGREKNSAIRWAKPHRRGVVLSLKGVEDRSSAESLCGSELLIEKSIFPETEDGTYYWSDIIGLTVYSAEGTYLGRVTSILPTGSNDVYMVQDNEKEILVPALEWVVLGIDLDKRRMTVNLPEGL